MKKHYLLALLVLFTGVALAQDYDFKTMEIPWVEGDFLPLLDGEMDDVYLQSPEEQMDRWNENAGQGADGTTVDGHLGTFRMLYSEEALYIYAEVTDDDFSDGDEIGIGLDIGGERNNYGWENTPKDDDAFLFFVITWKEYASKEADTVNHRSFSIVWNEGYPDFSFEAMIKWSDVSVNDQFAYDLWWEKKEFLFDIGIKNKYTDDDPAVGDTEYFQWSGNMNNFWQSSDLMGLVTFGQEVTSVSEFKNKDMNVYPNPANNQITIENSVIPSNLKIHNSAGKVVFETSNCSEQMQIDVSSYQKGLYILKADDRISKLILR